jgi:hypothetical protein
VFRRTLTLLAASSALAASCCDTLVGWGHAGCALAGDKVPQQTSAGGDFVKAARERVRKWSQLGLWLPEKDVPFFRDNYAILESVLRDALANSSDAIRQDAAYVVCEIGQTALPLEPLLLNRMEIEPDRTIRLYLYAAGRTIGTKSAKTLALLKGRFAALETQPDVRAHDYEYTPVDERIEIAAALLRLDDQPERQADYRDLILRWLKPAPKNLEAARQEAYWDHRWISVNVIENGGRPREAIPLLQAMLKEPRRKPWVDIKVSRALAVMGVSSRPQ